MLYKKYRIFKTSIKWKGRDDEYKRISLERNNTYEYNKCDRCKYNSLFGHECKYYTFIEHRKPYPRTVSLWFFCKKSKYYIINRIEDAIKTEINF